MDGTPHLHSGVGVTKCQPGQPKSEPWVSGLGCRKRIRLGRRATDQGPAHRAVPGAGPHDGAADVADRGSGDFAGGRGGEGAWMRPLRFAVLSCSICRVVCFQVLRVYLLVCVRVCMLVCVGVGVVVVACVHLMHAFR